MRHKEICWAPLRLCVFCVFAAIPAHADLVLNYIGVTASGSSLAGNPIALGTPFEINASFPDAMTPITTGIAVANTDSITIEVGGVSYSAIPGSGYSYVDFYDPANPAFAGFYAAGLYVTGGGFDPEYTAATPPLNALNPADTVLSGFLGDISPSASLPFETLAGLLVVTYDNRNIPSCVDHQSRARHFCSAGSRTRGDHFAAAAQLPAASSTAVTLVRSQVT